MLVANSIFIEYRLSLWHAIRVGMLSYLVKKTTKSHSQSQLVRLKQYIAMYQRLHSRLVSRYPYDIVTETHALLECYNEFLDLACLTE